MNKFETGNLPKETITIDSLLDRINALDENADDFDAQKQELLQQIEALRQIGEGELVKEDEVMDQLGELADKTLAQNDTPEDIVARQMAKLEQEAPQIRAEMAQKAAEAVLGEDVAQELIGAIINSKLSPEGKEKLLHDLGLRLDEEKEDNE